MIPAYDSLVINAPSLDDLSLTPSLQPFAPVSIAFAEALSLSLLQSNTVRAFPELVALAFWLRKTNIERIRTHLAFHTEDRILVPRGLAFHIAPANVDTIFVYSWFIALLTGNRNIIRLTSKPSQQTDMLLTSIVELLGDPTHQEIAKRTLLVRYTKNDQITLELSAKCDIRVVWGGDDTVRHIRKIAIPPTAQDIAFANKFSIALVDAERWIHFDEHKKEEYIAHFYNDAYWFDQMACSSPRMVLWIGDPVQASAASEDFWPRLEKLLETRQQRFSDIDYVNKRVTSDTLAIGDNIIVTEGQTNALVRIWLEQISLYEQHHCGAGLFLESALPTVSALRSLLNRKVQTVTYAGITKEEIHKFINEAPISGVDRFVPFGQALNFSPVWDGYDLPLTFMREITLA